eukprot:Hpha_TRINITY_DN15090_c0_g1::TRINITY_DN15090_c0_g1_i1::g.123353::m.123353/K06974/amzA, AMZ2, AMZ1; archaemetzincin
MVKFVQPDAKAVQSAMTVPEHSPHVSPGAGALLTHYKRWLDHATAPSAGLFAPLQPKSGDWLREHQERGQGVVSFLRRPLRAQPHSTFQTVVIQPVGEHQKLHEVLPPLTAWISAYYCLNVEVAPTVTFEEIARDVAVREHPDYGRQLHASKVIDFAKKRVSANRALSRTCCAVVALTMEDLYPRDAWNFVFGLARGSESAAVVSLVRYMEDDRCSILHRACKVLTHELGHIFGLGHCIYFGCLMNGSNHLEELDRNPLQLCPVCLTKTMITFQWNLLSRSRGILEACEALDISTRERAIAAELVASFESYERTAGPPPEAPARPAARRATAPTVTRTVPRRTSSRTRRPTAAARAP